jgi:hypothetical protein
MERLLKECLKQFEEVKDPKLEKSYQSLIKGVEKDLLALRNSTEEVFIREPPKSKSIKNIV